MGSPTTSKEINYGKQRYGVMIIGVIYYQLIVMAMGHKLTVFSQLKPIPKDMNLPVKNP